MGFGKYYVVHYGKMRFGGVGVYHAALGVTSAVTVTCKQVQLCPWAKAGKHTVAYVGT